MNNEIYILTGDIQTGKTTALMNWCKQRIDVAGILTPIIHGKRKFVNVFAKEIFDMEANNEEKSILLIGKYKFSVKAFDKAKQILLQSLPSTINYLVIDEIGFLEIKGEGFYECVRTILKENIAQKIILFVRRNLLADVVKIFDLEKFNPKIIDKSFFSV